MAIQKPFRAGVAALSESADLDCLQAKAIFDCTVLGPGASVEEPRVRLAWLIINACFIHAALGKREHLSPIAESTAWFFGSRELAENALTSILPFSIRAADQALSSVKVDQELWDLYPYVIEPQGHVSRSCLQREDARNVRKSKKADGVYYTPSDVADFMVSEIAYATKTAGAWIDPACGTGVFLRSIIAHTKNGAAYRTRHGFDFIRNHVYGIDKSALATDSAAFVMLAELELDDFALASPFEVWRRLKQNVACMDALAIATTKFAGGLFAAEQNTPSLTSLFPGSAKIGIRYLVMNPPYAASTNQKIAANSWAGLKNRSGAKTDLHLAFTEMMWRLDSIEAAAAVLPLSVATNTTRTYTAVRSGYLDSTGRKEMLFFDREPQALFGEDIKTRNAILFRFSSDEDSLYTSQLLKWTAPQREQILTRERLVRLRSMLRKTFVPKLGSAAEELAYESLCSHDDASLTDYASVLTRRTLVELVRDHAEDLSSISIGGTGYNYLNVFFSADLAKFASKSKSLSSSPTIFVKFPSEEMASAAYALLTSRLAFWLWRVQGDGFHVNSDFIMKLPFWRLLSDDSLRRELAENGRDVRCASDSSVTRSVNAGRETYSFHCGYDRASSRRVEELALARLIRTKDFSHELDRILHAVTSIDGKMRRAVTL